MVWGLGGVRFQGQRPFSLPPCSLIWGDLPEESGLSHRGPPASPPTGIPPCSGHSFAWVTFLSADPQDRARCCWAIGERTQTTNTQLESRPGRGLCKGAHEPRASSASGKAHLVLISCGESSANTAAPPRNPRQTGGRQVRLLEPWDAPKACRHALLV